MSSGTDLVSARGRSVTRGISAGQSSPAVCIVDDNVSVRKAVRRLVCSQGLKAVTFPCADDFLKYPDKEASACLILDVRMPGTSGPELQKRLVAAGKCIPIVFISGHEDEEVRREAITNGAVDFLYKPFDEQAMLRAVTLAIQQSKGVMWNGMRTNPPTAKGGG